MNVDNMSERETYLAYVVITAIESGFQGVGYWAEVEEYRWWLPDLDGGSAEPGPHGGGNAWAVLMGIETDERHDLTPKTISQAYKALTAGQGDLPDHAWPSENWLARARVARKRLDASLLDSADADMLVQLGLFGKLVY